MEAFIQKAVTGTLNREVARIGLSDAGYVVNEVDFVDPKFLAEEAHVFYGNVNWITTIVKNHGYLPMAYGYVPTALHSYAGREIKLVTLSEALSESKKQPVFIKPSRENHKAFNGCILSQDQLSLIEIANYELSDEVYLSPVIDIASEWRCFILNGKMLGIAHYKGDVMVMPNTRQINHMLAAMYSYHTDLIAYALDVGVTKDGQTIVIEVNDTLSLGWYGIHPRIAGSMLNERWKQIHKLGHT